MSTLRDFSQALYDFHSEKVDLYNSIESLCSVAKDYYITELGNVEESEFNATHLFGLTPSKKKSKLLTWITKEIQEINSKIEIIQAQDKNLELKLKQLDTEENAISTEIDAVKKVISKNVESSFKTFNA